MEEVFWNWGHSGGGHSCYLQIICRGTRIQLCATGIQLQISKAAHIREGTEYTLFIGFQTNSIPVVPLLAL